MSVGKPIKDIQLVFRQRGWGDDVEFGNIMDLIRNTASHTNQYLRNPFQETINVHPAPIEDYVPRILYRDSPNDPYIIRLTARNCYWAQYAYEFAHEFCHALTNYESLDKHPNNWFHETICELASVFTIRSMAQEWRLDPPFPQWKNFASDLDKYYEDLRNRDETKLPNGLSLNTWLLHNEKELREYKYGRYHANDVDALSREKKQRYKNALVAYQLLPIFEDILSGWNAIREYPISIGYLKDYLMDWYSLVDSNDKPFVARISNEFGYSITSDNKNEQNP